MINVGIAKSSCIIYRSLTWLPESATYNNPTSCDKFKSSSFAILMTTFVALVRPVSYETVTDLEKTLF
jgi:hypothetical protein